jgi:electron transport complex protein RnfG
MKNKSTLIKDAIMLFLITLVSGLALSYVYEITKAPIAEQQELKKQKANQAVFTDASSFETDEDLMNLAITTDLTTFSPDYDSITIDEVSKALDPSGTVLGYDITVTTNQSYDDSLTLVFGYSNEGTIKGLEFISLTETAGLGMKAKDAQFKNQFLNKKVSEFTVTKTGAASEDQIDAISGATITSRAVTNAINAGISFITENATDLGGGQ